MITPTNTYQMLIAQTARVMASWTPHSCLKGRMHTHTEASTPPEYANTTFSARPIDLSPWKTTEELLYLVGQSVFCHYEQTPKKEEQQNGMKLISMKKRQERPQTVRIEIKFKTSKELISSRSFSKDSLNSFSYERPASTSISATKIRSFGFFKNDH